MEIPFKEVKLSEVHFDSSKPSAFDTETIGLYGKIRLAQFYQHGWPEVLLVNYPNSFELSAKLNEAKQIIHNAHYDISCIQKETETRYVPNDYEDTFLLSRLEFYNKDTFTLDAVMTYVLGYDPYIAQDIDKKEMQKAKWDVPFLSTKQKLYASIDVFYLLQVYDCCSLHEQDTSYKLDKLTLNYCLDFQNNGMPVLHDELEKRYKNNIEEIESYNMPINVNSWQQVRLYIEHNESDNLALATQAILGNIKAKNVRTTRKLIKQNSFLTKFDTTIGRIFGYFKPTARSGRLTSNKQNLQQIPRLLKSIFGYSTEEGRCLIYADYAQLEIRSVCAITAERKMEALLREGKDIHNFTAIMLFGEGFTKIQRQIAKTANFALLYGAGVKVFLSILITQANLLLTDREGASTKKRWRNLWTSIAKWQNNGIEAWRNGIAWQTPFGRKYTAKLITDQLNIRNQGFGAEIAKLALHYMYPEIKRSYPEVKLLNFIHDSYIFESPVNEDVYKGVSEIVARCMQKAWFEALRTGQGVYIRDLPMPVDVFVGYNWGKIEDDYIYKHSLEGMKYYVS